MPAGGAAVGLEAGARAAAEESGEASDGPEDWTEGVKVLMVGALTRGAGTEVVGFRMDGCPSWW